MSELSGSGEQPRDNSTARVRQSEFGVVCDQGKSVARFLASQPGSLLSSGRAHPIAVPADAPSYENRPLPVGLEGCWRLA